MFSSGGGAPDNSDSGWIPVNPSADSNLIYVSSSTGVDAAGRGTIANPVATLAYAQQNTTIGTLGVGFRNGKPDWIFLKRGDTWTGQSLQAYSNISGRSAGEPMGIGAYGVGARPLIKCGATFGVQFSGGGGAMNFWMFDSLELYASRRDPNSPDFVDSTGDDLFQWNVTADGLTLQNLFIHFGQNNITLGDSNQVLKLTNTRINRCILADAYSIVSHSEGLYMVYHFNTQITGCVFDHNGWNENSTLFNAGADANGFNQNAYLNDTETAPNNPAQTSNPTVFRGNISVRAAHAGVSFRTGGIVYDNLFVRNPVAIDRCGVVASKISWNCILEGSDLVGNVGNGGSAPFGFGILFYPTVDLQTAQNNIIAHGVSSPTHGALVVWDYPGASFTNANPTTVSLSGDDFGQTNMQMLLPTAAGGFSAWQKFYAVSIVLAGGPGNGAAGTFQVASTPNGSPLASSAAFSGDMTVVPVLATNNIIYQWNTGGGFAGNVTDNSSDGHGNTMSPNDIDGAGPHIGTFPYPDSTRSVGSYAGTLGLTATLDAFMIAVKAQDKSTWRTALSANAVNNYIRQGFGLPIIQP